MVRTSIYACASIVILILCVACAEDKKYRVVHQPRPYYHKRLQKQEERRPWSDLGSVSKKRSTSFSSLRGKSEVSSSSATYLTTPSDRFSDRTGSTSSGLGSRGMEVIERKTARWKRSFGANHSEETSKVASNLEIDSARPSTKRSSLIGIADFINEEDETEKYSSSTVLLGLLDKVENVTRMKRRFVNDSVSSILVSSTVSNNQYVDSILKSLFVGIESDDRGLRGSFPNNTSKDNATVTEVSMHNDELASDNHGKSEANDEEEFTLKPTETLSLNLSSHVRRKRSIEMDRAIFDLEDERAALKENDPELEDDLYPESWIGSRQKRFKRSYVNTSLGSIGQRLSDSARNIERRNVTSSSSSANVEGESLLNFNGPSILSDVDSAIDRNLTDSLHIRVKRTEPDDDEICSSTSSNLKFQCSSNKVSANEMHSSYPENPTDSFSHAVRTTEAHSNGDEEHEIQKEPCGLNPEEDSNLSSNDINVQVRIQLVANNTTLSSLVQCFRDSEYPKKTNAPIGSIRRKRDFEYETGNDVRMDQDRRGKLKSVNVSGTGNRETHVEVDGKDDRIKWYYLDDEDTGLRNRLSDVYPDVVDDPDYLIPMVELIRKKRVDHVKVHSQLPDNSAELEDHEANMKSMMVEIPVEGNNRNSKISVESYPEDDSIIDSMLSKVDCDNPKKRSGDNEEEESKLGDLKKVLYAEKRGNVRTVVKRDLLKNDSSEGRREIIDKRKPLESPAQRIQEVLPLKEEAVASEVEEQLESDFDSKSRNKRKASLKKLQKVRAFSDDKILDLAKRKSKNHKKRRKMKHRKKASKVKRALENTMIERAESKVKEKRAVDRDLKIDSRNARNEEKIEKGKSLWSSKMKVVDKPDVNLADTSSISSTKSLENLKDKASIGKRGSLVSELKSRSNRISEVVDDYQVESKIEKRDSSDGRSEVDIAKRDLSRVKRHQDDVSCATRSTKNRFQRDNIKELKYYDDVREPEEPISQLKISGWKTGGNLRHERAAQSVEEIKGLMEKLMAKVTELQNWVGNGTVGSIDKGGKKAVTGNGTDDKNVGMKDGKNGTAKVNLCENLEERRWLETDDRMEKDRPSERRLARMLEDRRFRKRKRRKRKSHKKWDRWTDWSSCSVTCGRGRQIRWRHCVRDCTMAETEMEEKACQLPACGPGKFLGIF